MAEQPVDISEVEEPEAEQQQPRRNLMTLISILLLVVLVILVLLMLRGCGSTSGLNTRGAKTIESVDGADAMVGVISVWVEEDTDLQAVLDKAEVPFQDIVDLDGGRYLVVVTQGVELEAAQRIAEQAGVNDVGRVYESE